MLLCAAGLGQFYICHIADLAQRKVKVLAEIPHEIDDSYMDTMRIL